MSELTGTRLGARIAANAAVQVGGAFLASLVSLFTFAAITRYLGPTSFGYYSGGLAILAIPTIVSDLGLGTTVLRAISREPGTTSRLVGASLTSRLLVAVVAFSGTFAVTWLAPFPHETRMVTLVACGGSLLLLLNNGLLPALQAELRMHWAVIGNVSGRLVTLTIALLVLSEKLGLYYVVLAYVVGNAVTLAVVFGAVRWRVRVRPTRDLRHCWSLARSSLLVGAALMAGTLHFRIDMLLLAVIRPAAEVGLYAAAYKFVELSLLVIAAVTASIFPHMTRLVARGALRTADIQHTSDALLALGGGTAIVAFAHARHLVTLASGAKYAPAAPALQILAPAIGLSFLAVVFPSVLLAAQRERLLLLVNGVGFCVNLALNLALIPLFGYKAAAATTGGSVAVWFVVLLVVVRRALNLRPSFGFLRQVALAGCVMVIVLRIAPGPWPLVELEAGLAYVATLAVLPGQGSRLFLGLLTPAIRRVRTPPLPNRVS
jgi:O-antigen/teichoic acid export membrane protein